MNPRAPGPAFAPGFPASDASKSAVVKPFPFQNGVGFTVWDVRACIQPDRLFPLVLHFGTRHSVQFELIDRPCPQRRCH